ncbi:MAG: PAS domain S-box protein, partial [Desulfomonilaceae bacterium]
MENLGGSPNSFGSGGGSGRRSRSNTEAHRTVVYVNPAFLRITGYSAEGVIGGNPWLLKSNKHDDQFDAMMS